MKFFHEISKKALLSFLILPFIAYAENPNVTTQNRSFSNTQYSSEISRNQPCMNYQNSCRQPGAQNYRNNGYSYSDDCCDDPCNNCCGGQFWDTIKVPLIALVAGIGGGLIGAKIIGGGGHGHDGDDGDTGPQGATGAAGATGATGATGAAGPGFIADTGEVLTFNLTALFPATPAGSVTVTPFVTSPNGVTIEGGALISPTGGGTINFSTIIFPDPVFGFYNFGLSLSNTSTTTIAGITLNGTLISASRDSSVTNELTPLAGVSIAPGESQISSTFTYGPANVP